MRFSLVTLAITMVFGILLTSQFGILTAGVISLTAMVGFLIWSFYKKTLDVGLLIIIIAFAVSSFSYSFSVSSTVHKSLSYINRYVTLNGVIISTAEESADGYYRYMFRVKSITNRNGTVKAHDAMVLTTSEQLSCGSSVGVKGIIKQFPKQMNENGFDTRLYYKSNNIFSRIHSENIYHIDKIYTPSLYAVASMVSEKVDGVIYRHYTGDGAALLSAILTGNKHNFSEDYNDVLQATSYKRILHPAHLHIWIIWAVIGLFTRLVRKQYRDLAAAIIFIVYASLQCANIGFSRCLACAAITIIYRYRYGSTYFPDTMSVAVILCALVSPTLFFNCSFILSVAGGMISWAFMPYFVQKLRFLPKPIRRITAAMTVFALFLTPLSAYYFYGMSPYSFFTPFITTPLVLLILIISPITFLLYEIFGTAPILGAYLNFMVKILYKLPYIIKDLPFSYLNTGKSSIVFILMFLCVIFVVYYKIKSRKYHVFFWSAGAVGFGLSLVITTLMRLGTAEFMFVNVGQADGSVIHTPFCETVIIDGGGGNEWTDYNTGKALFVPYLQAMGINHIEVAIVSHFHQDHVEGVIDTIKSIPTDYVYAPILTDSDSESMREWASKLRKASDESGAVLCYVSQNTRLEFSDGLVIDIYAPPDFVKRHDENDTSLAVKASFGEFSALYTGDMTSFSEREFISRRDAGADVLKVAHHGSRDSSANEFLEAVSPDYAVISCGENNVYAHPHSETLERLRGTAILRTDLMGDIRISARKNGNCDIK